MMNYSANDWRSRRNLLNLTNMNQALEDSLQTRSHYTIPGYCTEQQKMNELNMFADDVLHNFHIMSDPLKKNLADTILTVAEEKPSRLIERPRSQSPSPLSAKTETKNIRQESYPSFSGIGNFISGFFSIISGAVFQKRAKPPASQYEDCYESNNHITESLNIWQPSRIEDQNIIEQGNGQSPDNSNKMNTDCITAVSSCEDKLKELKELLAKKKQKKDKKVEVKENKECIFENGTQLPEILESCSEEKFEDALSSPDLAQDTSTNSENGDAINETMEIVKNIPNSIITTEKIENTKTDNDKKASVDKETVKNTQNNAKKDKVNIKNEKAKDSIPKSVHDNEEINIVNTCEAKLADLINVIQIKRKNAPPIQPEVNNTDDEESDARKTEIREVRKPPIPIPIRPNDKRFKNPNRLAEKRKRVNLLKNIKDDMKFATELDTEVASSLENSPRVITPDPSPKSSEYFDEITGKFHSSSATDSEESFQIVFADSPHRSRKVSECDSEDSFIIFQESPDSCYTTTDVFGHHDELDCDSSDADSEVSDSGFVVPCQMANDFSRTVSDLTDDSLFGDACVVQCTSDELDCAVRSVCDGVPGEGSGGEVEGVKSVRKGMLLDEARKLMKKDLPPKKVTFSAAPPEVKVMRVWAFASKQARIGDWQQQILDRDRFKRRIADVDVAVSWVLKPQHRSRVMFQRFMPWWNALRRKEIAEKKEQERLRKEAEEKQRIEDEKRRVLEEKIRLEEEEKERIRKLEEDERLLEEARKRIEAERKKLEKEERKQKRPGYQKAQEKKLVRNALMRRSFKRLEKNLARFNDVGTADGGIADITDGGNPNININAIESDIVIVNGENDKESIAKVNNSKMNIEKISPTRDKDNNLGGSVISDT